MIKEWSPTHALRHRYLDEDDGKWGKILYYGLSAAWSPLIGIPLFNMMKKSKPMTEEEERRHNRGVCPSP